jgi:large subunit ribosomal protein L7Ae
VPLPLHTILIIYLSPEHLTNNHGTEEIHQPVKGGKAAPAKASVSKVDPLFPSRPRSFNVGGAIRPTGRNLSRFVRWPKYVRILRQRAVLCQRLKVHPAINQFTKSIDKNEASNIFKLCDKYCRETVAAKKQRQKESAASLVKGIKAGKTANVPHQLKFGLKHITTLVEEKKASIVLIACDVNPIELVLWLPALCRKMEVPFLIIKDKARLGTLVHQKKSSRHLSLLTAFATNLPGNKL